MVSAEKNRLKPRNSQPSRALRRRSSGSGGDPLGRRRIAASAGLRVSELMAESTVETAIVRANCRKNCPTIPVMKPQGTNTAHSTRATPMMGPVTSSIARSAASLGERPCSIHRSTFSTTTIASSTTMPIASTSPNSDSELRLNPSACMKASVPTIATGTEISGMRVARHFCRNRSITRATRITAMPSVRSTSRCDSSTKGVVSYTTRAWSPVGNRDLSASRRSRTCSAVCSALEPGSW